MAYDYDRTKQLYEQLNDAEKQQFASQNQGNKNYESFINQYNSENQGGTVKAPDYENQGEGNYVYNEKTGYYENTSKPTSVTQEEPTKTPVVTPTKQEDVVKEETIVKSDNTLNQEGALAPLSEEYYSQTSQDAQDKIVSNLNGYRQTNPEYFSDYESFKKNFSYDLRNDEQKNTLDTWYKGYTKGMELSSVPVIDLYTQYKDGDISVSDLETLRIANPTKYTELQNQINKGNIIAAYDDDKGQAGFGNSLQEMSYNMMVQTFSNLLGGDKSSGASTFFKEYENNMKSPEMVGLGDRCTQVQEEMENIQSDLDAIKKSVEKEYEGTGASRAKINAIISDRSYDLQLQLRTLNSEYNKYATQYNNRMQQYQNEFNLQLQEYQIHQQERQQQMNELGFAMDLMNFETNDQKAEREWNYWVKQQEYQNGNINSKDYSTRYKAALNSVQNLLSQYEGIPMLRSAEQMAQDILTAIDNGSDLGTELTKINKQIQQKDEYKILYNQAYGTSNSGFGKTIKLGDMEFVEYNGSRYTADEIKDMFSGGQAKPYDAVSESAFSIVAADKRANNLGGFLMDTSNSNGKTGGQCGKFVNNYLEKIGVGRYYDNELSTKKNSVNSQTPKTGTIAVFDYGHESSDGINHGHVGIVVQVNDDGSFYVKDSNFDGDEKIQRRLINPNSTSLLGFFDPSKSNVSSGSTGGSQSFVSGSIEGVPLAYERAVKNLVPAALQNSDAEREALNTIIRNAHDGGIDQSEIALTFMGFDIRNDDDKDLAMDLVNTVRTLSTDTQEGIVQTISDLMNQGNYIKAIQTVENAVSQQAQAAGNYVSEASVKNTINKANDLSNYMSGLKQSPTGVIEGTMQEWLGRLSSKQAKEISSRIGLIESSLDIKDQETLQRILPQLSDQPSVFMSKLNNLGDNAMLELNGWRTIYGLPSLTQDAVINHSNRVDLYKNGGTTTIQNTTVKAQTDAIAKNNVENAVRALNLRFGLK